MQCRSSFDSLGGSGRIFWKSNKSPSRISEKKSTEDLRKLQKVLEDLRKFVEVLEDLRMF
jgi:hypothetical protein